MAQSETILEEEEEEEEPEPVSSFLERQMALLEDESEPETDIFKSTFDLDLMKKNNEIKQFPNSKRTFQCGDCFKIFPFRSSFIIHKRIHTGERPFTCEFCDKCFSQKHKLKMHQLVHFGKTPSEYKDFYKRRNLNLDKPELDMKDNEKMETGQLI